MGRKSEKGRGICGHIAVSRACGGWPRAVDRGRENLTGGEGEGGVDREMALSFDRIF
ncbi:protein of unknown function [Kyrpidia spormannii]|uniref:Uncharacterized protein n=2 Tax=Kyrpidia spormannii TaxID=2055160 RepID=A0ACA8ZCL3_9BACL|nr:protein of unknown function [Kyrpidia spormannii]CAB3395167.1 protein of unknown function [Kyrpidia spormannii]